MPTTQKIEQNAPKLGDSDMDGRIGDLLVQVKSGLREVSRLQGSLFELAKLAAVHPDKRVRLVLLDPELSMPSLKAGWESATRVIDHDLIQRMGVWIEWNEAMLPTKAAFPRNASGPTSDERVELKKIVAAYEKSDRKSYSKRGDAYTEILKALLYARLKNLGPVPSVGLREVTGYSYPTIAKALKRLEHCLLRHSNRKVILDHFPKEEWLKLIHSADDFRSSVRFTSRGDQARSPQSLLRRVAALKRDDIAIGGVEGARHYCPELDLIGLPRLDVCVHSPGGRDDHSFVESLDPALEPTIDRGAATSLVVHFLHRPEALFEKGEEGGWFADPVECLLDLHDAKLEQQAQQLIQKLEKAREDAPDE